MTTPTGGNTAGKKVLQVKGFDQPNTLRASLPPTPDTGNFFAPFFDVVFYRPSEETGTLVPFGPLPQFFIPNPGLFNAATASQVEQTRTIGGSSIRLRSANGNLQLFEPDKDLADIRNFAANLVVEVRAAAAYRATLTLSPPYEDALKLIDSEAIRFGSLMEVQWGYLNSTGGEPLLSDKGLFSIVQPSVSLGKETTITISGWDLLSSAGGTLERRCAYPREQFRTDLDVLRAVAKKINPSLTIDDSKIAGDSDLKKAKEGQPLVQRETDIRFFQKVCFMNDVTYTFGGKNGANVILQDQAVADVADPVYDLVWYQNIKTAREVPMIAFESNSIPSLFAAQGSRGYLTFSHNLDDDETKEEENKPEDQGSLPGNTTKLSTSEAGHAKQKSQTSGQAAQPYAANDEEGLCASGKIWVVPDQRPNQRQERINKARNQRRVANTRANVTIPGHPPMLPMMIVNVKGVGKKFGGTYRILKLSHEIGTGGYITKLDLLRASTSGDPGSSDPSAKPPVNRNLDPDKREGGEASAQQSEPSSGFIDTLRERITRVE